MSDLINGREMLNRLQVDLCLGIACKDCSMSTEDGGCKVEEWIDKFPSADRPQGKVNAVMLYEQAISDLEHGKITLGEYETRIEPLMHLYYDRPQGEWMHDTSSPIAYRCSVCNTLQHWSVIQNGRYHYCPNCGCRMKGADDE